MSDSYKYIDPEYICTDPRTGILRNLENITDENILVFAESGAVAKRVQELYEKPIKVVGISSLLSIHQHLFQDIYAWAGKPRTVNISKNGKPFFNGERFDMAFQYIDRLIAEYKAIHRNKKAEIAKKLAEIIDNVNFLHPFREGNGRTQREFIRLLALDKGMTLNFTPTDNIVIYDRYMQGTINSDVELLTELIYELISNQSK